MNFITAALNALKEFFGWRKIADDPETKRKARLDDIEKALKYWRGERDRILATKVTKHNEEALAIALGNTVNHILRLRKERALTR